MNGTNNNNNNNNNAKVSSISEQHQYSLAATAAATATSAAAATIDPPPSHQQQQQQQQQPSSKLELTIHPDNGALQTVSLYQVLLATMDALYTDLYNMAQGELDVYTTTTTSTTLGATTKQPEIDHSSSFGNHNDEFQSEQEGVVNGSVDHAVHSVSNKKERLINLSFAQRRHELSWRLAQNMKCLQQVAALTAVSSVSSVSTLTPPTTTNNHNNNTTTTTTNNTTDTIDFGTIIQWSNRALQHVHTAWIQADMAQDALYFFHAQLFPARQAPCDIYGASDVVLHGRWYDLPYDVRIQVDPYQNSIESSYTKREIDQRWQLAVRDKLLMGEVGYMRRQQLLKQQQQRLNDSKSSSCSSSHNNNTNNNNHRSPFPWTATVTGGIVQLTAGRPKYNDSTSTTAHRQYPIEAILTVFPSPPRQQQQQTQQHSTDMPNVWTLLSINVSVAAKTGEYNHQLDISNRQRYDLHRIAMTAMRREEIRHHREGEQEHEDTLNTNNHDTTQENGTILSPPPSRPLQALFDVLHMCLMAWQLELISAQAQALRRGGWAATTTTTNVDGSSASLISVTPVRFFDNSDGHMSISFWKVDDSYGPPSMGDLNRPEQQHHNASTSNTTSLSNSSLSNRGGISSLTPTGTSQLTLTIRAESTVGIIVSLSGGADIMKYDGAHEDRPFLWSTIHDLIEAATNPMAISASDALLSATKLCAELKCQAVVNALQPQPTTSTNQQQQQHLLPPWIRLRVQSGCIVVAVNLNYHGIPISSRPRNNNKSILFHMVCNARTGSFVMTFPHSMHLLRQLVCDDIHASTPVALRIASLPLNRRRIAASNSTGRVVRDTFDSLVRSMNLLGQRVGVGTVWDDIDDRSHLLRQRAVQSACVDVKTALISCCGMAALYGVVPLAMGCAVGLAAITDIAGPPLEPVENNVFLKTPPLSVMLGQDMVETTVVKSEGVSAKKHHLEQDLFSFTCSSNEDGLCIFPFTISVKLESPSSFVERISYSIMEFQSAKAFDASVNGESGSPPSKRLKVEQNDGTDHEELQDVMTEVEVLSELISATIDDDDVVHT